MISDVAMVQMMIGRLCQPVARMTERFRPKPKKDHSRLQDVFGCKGNPAFDLCPVLEELAGDHAEKDGDDRPANDGKGFPQNQDGRAMTRQSAMPGSFDGFMMIASSYCGNKRRSD